MSVDVVLLGDSITFAWPVPPADRHRRLHRGIPGETARDMLARLDRDVLAHRPAMLHLMAGTNDIAGNGGAYEEAVTLDAMAAIVAAAGAAGIAVLVGSVPPAAAIPWNPAIAPVPAIRSLNRALRPLAERSAEGFVDYDAVLADGAGAMRAGLADDGLHPNAAGYAAMEPLAAAAIGAALAIVRRRRAR